MSSPVEPLPWTEAVRAKDSPERAAFLESHVDLVKYLALRISGRLPANVELDDLINDGILGLLDAVDKYDASRGARFRTYAESRVRGAILDGLRRKDWRPRSVRNLKRNLDTAIGEIASRQHRSATEEEIAEELGLDLRSYRTQLREMNVGPLLSLEDLPVGNETPIRNEHEMPDSRLERDDLIRVLCEEIDELPERERYILQLYYHEGLNMKEVGAVLGITESRVCQLHSQAAGRLRVGLERRLHVQPVGHLQLTRTGKNG